MKLSFSVAGLIMTLILVGFLESPNRTIEEDNISTFDSSPNQGTEEASTKEENEYSYSSLELVFEGRQEVDGYMVEAYREYEIYEDDNGNVLKKEPTSNYNYIRYSDYQE